MRLKLLGGAAAAMAVVASGAQATTKVFDYSELGTNVATGAFSYATGDTGVLGYGDLTAFSLTVAGVTYDLAEVKTLTDHVHFGYDTAGNDFVNLATCGFGGCGFASSLSAADSSATDGFFFSATPGFYVEYSTSAHDAFDTITISDGGVPEPSSWALMLLGLGGLGVSMRSRRKAGAAAA